MILILTEKPSVAKDIAKIIGAVWRTDEGYLRNRDYIVANCVGHLVELAKPDDYGGKYKKWEIEDLPFFPQQFLYLPAPGKEDVLNGLVKLMNSPDVDGIICACDAGREGEVIFRYVYDYAKCRKPYKRLWISSLTEESITEGMAHLIEGKENLYQAGAARAKADWIVGMNLTRLYSAYFGAAVSIGRVITPTLNMIVKRDLEIENFKKKTFYKLLLENGAEWFEGEKTSFETKEEAERTARLCEKKTAKVERADVKRKSENRPLLYSLTALQQDANECFGFSAALTLNIAQMLYEKKLLTYPRTQSRYLTEDMKPEAETIIERLSFFDEKRVKHLAEQGLNTDKRVFDNSKIGDHHAIIPTKDIAKSAKMPLTENEKSILSLVIERFFLAFEQPYVYDEFYFVFNICENRFGLTVCEPVSYGWRQHFLPDDEISRQQKPHYKENDIFFAEKTQIKECETLPPKAFTDSTLLSAMENASKRVEDKELGKFIKESGIGTTATRAKIIEELITKDFVKRERKKLVSTEKGRYVTEHLPEAIKSVELTAEMERKLLAIENGEAKAEDVTEEAKKLVTEVIEIEKNRSHENLKKATKTSLGKCPKCGGNVYEGRKGFYCENFKEKERCGFYLWKNDIFYKARKKILTANVVSGVLKKGKVLLTKCWSEKSGKYYDAYVGLKEYTDKKGEKKMGFEILEFRY